MARATGDPVWRARAAAMVASAFSRLAALRAVPDEPWSFGGGVGALVAAAAAVGGAQTALDHFPAYDLPPVLPGG